MITRRKILIALGAAGLAKPLAPLAQQQPVKTARIGFLGATSASNPVSIARIAALRSGLRELGYVEGKNLVIEFRWAEDKYERFPELAAELVRLKLDLIMTHVTPGAFALKRATTTIPVVMAVSTDPIRLGIAASLARPGGNFTGTTFFNTELAAKRLELLKDAIPRVKRVAVLVNPDHPDVGLFRQAMEPVAKSLKLELQHFGARGPEEFEGAFAAMVPKRVNAVAIIDEPMLNAHLKRIADLAAGKRLPSIGTTELAKAGGLISYGVNFPELYRRAAFFVDRILKGAKPGDIPFERAAKFELIINRKTARALGLKIPQELLLRADQVIE